MQVLKKHCTVFLYVINEQVCYLFFQVAIHNLFPRRVLVRTFFLNFQLKPSHLRQFRNPGQAKTCPGKRGHMVIITCLISITHKRWFKNTIISSTTYKIYKTMLIHWEAVKIRPTCFGRATEAHGVGLEST